MHACTSMKDASSSPKWMKHMFVIMLNMNILVVSDDTTGNDVNMSQNTSIEEYFTAKAISSRCTHAERSKFSSSHFCADVSSGDVMFLHLSITS